MTKKQIIYVLAIVLVLFEFFFNKVNLLPKTYHTSINIPNPTIIITPYEKQKVKVVRVIDGDTIEIEGKQKVRYTGINSAELHDPRRPVGCFAQAAADENRRLVEGKEIIIQKDVSEVDKYKRLLRYVWIGDIFINDYLIRQGFAQVSTYPPDVKYQQQFMEAQTEAKENNRGLWKECPSN